MRTATEDKAPAAAADRSRPAEREIERACPCRGDRHVGHHQHGHRQHRRAGSDECGGDEAWRFSAKTTPDAVRHQHQKSGRHGDDPEHRLLSADELRQRQQHRQSRRIRRHDDRRLRVVRTISERTEDPGGVREGRMLDEWLLDFQISLQPQLGLAGIAVFVRAADRPPAVQPGGECRDDRERRCCQPAGERRPISTRASAHARQAWL